MLGLNLRVSFSSDFIEFEFLLDLPFLLVPRDSCHLLVASVFRKHWYVENAADSER